MAEEPTFTVEESAARLGITVDALQRFIDEKTPYLIAERFAHYDDDGNLIIDGGGS